MNKVWYVETGFYYEGADLAGIYGSYNEAAERYEKETQEYYDTVWLYECDLDKQRYTILKHWSTDDE